MIIDPKTILERRILASTSWEESQVQPNGIDLKLDLVFQIHGSFTLYANDSKKNTQLLKVEPDTSGYFHLSGGKAYNVLMMESVRIPSRMCAEVIGRSTLNRNGIFARSTLYDAGFDNTVGFTLYPWVDCSIQKRSRIAQIIFYEAQGEGHYSGQYSR